MRPYVVRVRIVLVVVAVGDDDLRPHTTDLGHEALDGLVQRRGRQRQRGSEFASVPAMPESR